MSTFESFEELKVYQVAREFRIVVARWAKTLPAEERYRLADQVIRAARSITANIAEGFGRQHPKENLQFCRQARGSLMELLDHLNAAFDESLISQNQYAALCDQFDDVKRLLSGYIRYLQTLTKKDTKFKNE